MIAEPRSWGKCVYTPANHPALLQWQRIRHSLHDPHLELDVETFAAISAAIDQLERIGASVDDGLLALVNVLRRQAADTVDGDGDATEANEGEPDDVEEQVDPYQQFAIIDGERVQVRGVLVEGGQP